MLAHNWDYRVDFLRHDVLEVLVHVQDIGVVPHILEELRHEQRRGGGCLNLVEDAVQFLLGFFEVLVCVLVDSSWNHGAVDGDVGGTTRRAR